VRGWFIEAVGARPIAVPNDDQCALLAHIIAGLFRDLSDRGEPMTDLLGAARAPLKQAAKRLPATRAGLDWMAAKANWPESYKIEIANLIQQYSRVEAAISSALRTADAAEKKQGGGYPTYHATARSIGNFARAAWRGSGVEPPTGIRGSVRIAGAAGAKSEKTPGDPLCVFVKLALNAAGINVDEHGVSDALRAREGRIMGRKK
jgi:hypothetical protein